MKGIGDMHPSFISHVYCAKHLFPGSACPYPRRERWAASSELLLWGPCVREGLPFKLSCQVLLHQN